MALNHYSYLYYLDAKKKAVTETEIVQGDSLSKDARKEVLSGVLSQIERSYGKGKKEENNSASNKNDKSNIPNKKIKLFIFHY